jgi:AraC-like DNA-binding protein
MSAPPGRLANKPVTHDVFASAAIRKAKRHVEERYTEKISSRDLAQLVGLSPEHFCRTFKQATGVRLTEYIARLRVTKACEALVHSDQPISHIALDCGFQSLAQFNKTFKKYAGTSPTDYRALRRS